MRCGVTFWPAARSIAAVSDSQLMPQSYLRHDRAVKDRFAGA
jgi:hypothetical protein